MAGLNDMTSGAPVSGADPRGLPMADGSIKVPPSMDRGFQPLSDADDRQAPVGQSILYDKPGETIDDNFHVFPQDTPPPAAAAPPQPQPLQVDYQQEALRWQNYAQQRDREVQAWQNRWQQQVEPLERMLEDPQKYQAFLGALTGEYGYGQTPPPANQESATGTESTESAALPPAVQQALQRLPLLERQNYQTQVALHEMKQRQQLGAMAQKYGAKDPQFDPQAIIQEALRFGPDRNGNVDFEAAYARVVGARTVQNWFATPPAQQQARPQPQQPIDYYQTQQQPLPPLVQQYGPPPAAQAQPIARVLPPGARVTNTPQPMRPKTPEEAAEMAYRELASRRAR